MRVAVVTPWFPRHGDGAGSFVEDQVRSVAGTHELAVIHLARRAAAPIEAEQGENWRVLHCAPRVPNRPGLVLVRDFAAATSGLRRLRREGFTPDLVHAHVFSAGLAVLPIARRRRVPLVLSEHLSDVSRGRLSRRAGRLAGLAYRGAELVCPVSESLRAGVERLAPGAQLRVVPNSVDERLFRPSEALPAEGPLHVLAVASLVSVKRIELLLEAVGLVAARRRDFALTVIGDGPLRSRLQARIDSGGLSDLLELAGPRARPEVADALRNADLLVVPSEWETFSVAAAEALMCGVPVLATRTGALPELIGDGNGRLVDPLDARALAAGLDAMLDSARRYDRRTIARAALERFGASSVGSAWSAIYAELAGAPPAAHGPMAD
jgi:glycosyltransferase involved in cell wall biosynthesis